MFCIVLSSRFLLSVFKFNFAAITFVTLVEEIEELRTAGILRALFVCVVLLRFLERICFVKQECDFHLPRVLFVQTLYTKGKNQLS